VTSGFTIIVGLDQRRQDTMLDVWEIWREPPDYRCDRCGGDGPDAAEAGCPCHQRYIRRAQGVEADRRRRLSESAEGRRIILAEQRTGTKGEALTAVLPRLRRKARINDSAWRKREDRI
jgi:hypothetical protein